MSQSITLPSATQFVDALHEIPLTTWFQAAVAAAATPGAAKAAFDVDQLLAERDSIELWSLLDELETATYRFVQEADGCRLRDHSDFAKVSVASRRAIAALLCAEKLSAIQVNALVKPFLLVLPLTT